MLKNYAHIAMLMGKSLTSMVRHCEDRLGIKFDGDREFLDLKLWSEATGGESPLSDLPLAQTKKLMARHRARANSISEAVKKNNDPAKHPEMMTSFWDEYRKSSIAILERAVDEIEEEQFYYVKSELRQYYDCRGTFGDAVFTAFPRAIDDIEPAGKCLALGQPTACVFHLMRAMEGVVAALCTKLGIAPADREWGKLLSAMEDVIEAMPKGPLRDRWSEAHSRLYHLKQAWRNDTMHPKRSYQPFEAQEVFDAVRAFMTHLASLMT
jgi:hypothetical protein